MTNTSPDASVEVKQEQNYLLSQQRWPTQWADKSAQ